MRVVCRTLRLYIPLGSLCCWAPYQGVTTSSVFVSVGSPVLPGAPCEDDIDQPMAAALHGYNRGSLAFLMVLSIDRLDGYGLPSFC